MANFQGKKIILITTCLALLMFGFSFALSPLYRLVCKKTGLNGGINVAEIQTSDTGSLVHTEPVLVQFIAVNNASLPWEFYSRTNEIAVLPEQITKIIFHVKNNSPTIMTVQAVPSFSPAVAAQYFHKIECFCFTQQTLKPGEEKDMPVVFRVDKQLPIELHTITLAYTLFEVRKNMD